MNSMFRGCSKLTKLDLQNFNTEKVTKMWHTFNGCSSLTDLKFGKKFNTEKVMKMENMFSGCSSFPEEIRNNLNDVKAIIAFFKKDN